MKVTSGRCRLLVAAVLALGLAGCGYGRREVVVRLDCKDERGTMPSVKIHMIGVSNPGEYRRLRDLSMTEYWTWQKDAKVYEMEMGEGLKNPQILSRKDPIWKNWSEAKLLVVLSSFPPSKDLPGDADARRLILPLKRSSWQGSSTPIVVKATGLVCDQAYKPNNPFEN
ncbi:MAG: hypothetical protein HQ546_06790 [Planctomycetes bacterium]|nr:hypothetical protein [Planctomycetota bacterium]